MKKMTFIHVKPFIYGHIRPCKWIKIALNFKFQAQSSKLKLHVHAQAILYVKKGRYETCLNFACSLSHDHRW
jgi:hypothetical protein